MLELFIEAPWTLRRFRSSPVGHYIDIFAAALHEMGYAWRTGRYCLRHAVHLGHWAARMGIPISALDERSVDDFEAHFPDCDYPFGRVCKHAQTTPYLRVFLQFLRASGIAKPAPDSNPPRPPVLDGFEDWMRTHTGVTERTVRIYGQEVLALTAQLGDDVSRYSARALRAAIVSLVADFGASKAGRVVTATRAFLRYQAAIGRCSSDLVGAIPGVAGWTQTTLPKHLPAEDVEKLIESCKPTTRPGLRDRAILLLLARLGLRAGDVAALRLPDIDWAIASIKVSGKGRREAKLPLSQEVGDAILAYLDEGRPQVGPDRVFFAIRAPWRPLTSGSVSATVVRAIRRAGVTAPTHGAHLLRHSAATSMLRQGASLYAIGTVLRHQSIETTAQYARVDKRLLLEVAQPWLDGVEPPGDGGAKPAPGGIPGPRQLAQPRLEGESC